MFLQLVMTKINSHALHPSSGSLPDCRYRRNLYGVPHHEHIDRTHRVSWSTGKLVSLVGSILQMHLVARAPLSYSLHLVLQAVVRRRFKDIVALSELLEVGWSVEPVELACYLILYCICAALYCAAFLSPTP